MMDDDGLRWWKLLIIEEKFTKQAPNERDKILLFGVSRNYNQVNQNRNEGWKKNKIK